MFGARQHTAAVLAELGAAADLSKARASVYREVDFAIRAKVRRNVRDLVGDVLRETNEEDEGRTFRRAYLRLVGVEDGGLTAGEVDAAFHRETEEIVRPVSGRANLQLLGLTLTIVAALIAGVYWVTRPPIALRSQEEENPRAWQDGGRPRAGSPEVRAFFESTIPDWAAQLDRVRFAYREEFEMELADEEMLRVEAETLTEAELLFGANIRSFLHAVLHQSKELVQAKTRPAAHGHIGAVDAFNREIADRGLGYFLDLSIVASSRGGPGSTRIFFSTYGVEDVRFLAHEDGRVRSLRLRRLDESAFERPRLGFTRRTIDDALILESQIEEHLAEVLMTLGADETIFSPDREFEQSVELREAIAADIALAGEALHPSSVELGEALAARHQLFVQWRSDLRDSVRFIEPRRIDVDLEAYALIEESVPRHEWRALEHAMEALEADEVRGAYRAWDEAFGRVVALHESQHRLDYAPSADARIARVMEERYLSERSVLELSAYLRELSGAQVLARVDLALLGRHLYLSRRPGPLSQVMAILFTSLGESLDLEFAPLIQEGRIDRSAFARLYLALRGFSEEEIQRAAAEAHASIFGEPLNPLTFVR